MVSKKCKLNFIQIQTIKSHAVFFTVGAVRRRRHGYPVDRADSLQYFAQGLSQFGWDLDCQDITDVRVEHRDSHLELGLRQT